MEGDPANVDRKWLNIADTLSELQAKYHNGRGVSCVQTVILYLRMGDIDKARITCYNESDKIVKYQDVKTFLQSELFAGEAENPWSILDRLQQEKK